MPTIRTSPTTTTSSHRDVPGPDADESAAGARTEPQPLSFAQQRLWTLAQLTGAGEAYNESVVHRLRGPLDRGVLARALDAIVVRHEVLRTRLVPAGGEVHQWIDRSDIGYPLLTDDLTGVPDPEARLAALQRAEATAPFDLGSGPLARGRLVTLAPDHHALLLTMHHTVFDGSSMDVMMRELTALYSAFLRGDDDPLPPLPLQYADYARRQREWMDGTEQTAQADYWQQNLAGAPPLLELPTDRPRPPEQDHHGGRVAINLDEELTAGLRTLARQHGGTLFVAALTGWSLMLSRLAGETDLVVGVPTANRRSRDLAGLIGFFVNSLAVRVDLSDAPTVSTALGRTRAAVRGALDHQDLPFERVVELVNPPRSNAHSPLFQTMFAWQPSRSGLLDLPGIEADPLEIPFAAAKFDLALSLAEEDGRLVGHLDYATALFDHESAERYAGYLRRVLAQMVAEPDRQVAELTLMAPDERHRLLTDWDATQGAEAVPPSGLGGLIERFEARVRAHPDGPALVCADGRTDYAVLERRANRLAHALIARGIGPDQVVGLHAGRSTELVVGVLGILKAGAAFLPLDPGQPIERLTAMVTDAAPALVLSTTDDWQDLRSVEAEGVRDDAPAVAVGPSQLAYVLYTSGSTGRPKGVAVTHGSVLNLLDTWLARFGPTPGEASSAWSSISFDATIHELLLPLTTGAVLHLVPDDLRADPEALLDWMRRHRIVQAFLPPAYVRWIDEAPEERLAGLALRQLLTGVESLPEIALHRMTQVLPGLRICYGYGPTESTVYCTFYTDPQPLDRPCPIGRPLGNTRLYLLDERLQPVPTGVTGEVWTGGAGLAAGYLNRPDLTDERFLPDPFVPGERIYRTGDLARRLPDGNAEFLGRRDDQVKLRGFRIEPREVEAALLAVSGVREAAVLADRDDAGELRLVAAIGRGDTEPRQPHEWRAALAERLPDYMIPALFVELPALPLNRSGKLDRAELLRQARTAAPQQVNTATPRDHVELALHRIWTRVLVHPAISITDNFFEIGGTSISAIKVAAAVREEFGDSLPIRDVISHPTIETLAERLRTGTARQLSGNLIEFRKGDGRRRVVCVHPAGGTAFCYLSLAAALPEEIGVYGIQSPGLDPGETPLPTVEAMAREYLRLVEPRADESLVLCGLSYGGLVAHEMGRLLAEAGHPRFSVVLLDSRSTDDPQERAAIEPVEAADFREKLVRFNGMYPGIEDAQIDRYFRIYNHNRMSARAYLVPPSPARLVFVQASGEDEDVEHEARAFWQRRAGDRLLVEPVGCGHWDMLESDAVPQIAKLIVAELVRVPAQPASAGPSDLHTVREA
ncbi:amino acid adenylation domain-containing protein [Kitasatospora sp. MAP5-34]|uniref:non-ribosomal peptide synthetase n=1 Tax=Kitasatospora sp. MAP5-34 TaxID=3035102 RepID=UPI00247559F3|nr:amino acid adenylation domain-containing protein [Kitasatospora sp. MAP5-34]MDH6579155.1 amino acid adenylation domain-containing protein [Kitasatospora sp. MAP5-34]